MMRIKIYQQEPSIRKQLLELLEAVDQDFLPPLSRRKPLEFWLKLFDKGILLYACEDQIEPVNSHPGHRVNGFLAFYPTLKGGILESIQPYVSVGPVVSIGEFQGAYLHFIAVSPSARGKKVASLLLDALSQEIERRQIPAMRVITWSTNTASLELYKKKGYFVFHRIKDDRGKGVDSIYLEKKAELNVERRLAQLVKQVVSDETVVPVYRLKYNDFSIDEENFDMEMFRSLPFFTRDEYRRERTDDLYYPLPESHYVFISGGSTGISKASFWNISYIENQITTLAKTFQSLGITKQHRAINLFTPGMSGTHYGFNLALEKIGAVIVPLGGATELPVIARFIKDLEVDVLIGNPSTLILVLEYLTAQNLDFAIDTIIYAGENLSDVQLKFMKQHAAHIYSPIYSSTETGIIGTQCLHVPAGTFHLTDSVFVELIDPGTAEPTDSLAGEIVVTSLPERSAPCIRYRLGDRITFIETGCQCGSSERLFRLEGRIDDAVTIGSTNWSYDEIVSPLVEHLGDDKNLSRNFCLKLEEKQRKVKLTIVYQLAKAAGNEIDSQPGHRVQTYMDTLHPIVAPLVKKNVIYPIAVERVGSFESLRNPQTGKIRMVIDTRRS